ncbi:MAG: glycerol-3-phosphate 1-O-acyltransferase PlsY [Eubacteriales bacterium]|nr:glycerol-3-phosphate 1-O-acyltransferase PlsY [Eubacteriales bacterium]
MIVARILCLLIGYGFGLLQTAYLYGKYKGFDIRTKGSGNAGTTNMLRTLGKKAGALTLAGDMLKCVIAVFITWLLFRNRYPDYTALLKIWTAFGVIIGHDFPFYMNFKGGKGVAACAGLFVAFGDWRLFLLGFVSFFGLLFITHYVSLSALLVHLELLAYMIVVGSITGFGMPRAAVIELIVITALIAALTFWKHRGNIQRLLHGSERKTYLTKKSEQ